MSETFKLVVGLKKKEFTVHKKTLITTSDFFKACCDGHDWKESNTKTIELPEEDPEAVSTYLSFLYTGELVVTKDALPTSAETSSKEERWQMWIDHYWPLFGLAFLSDKFGDAALNNAVMDAMIHVVSITGQYLAGNGIRFLYSRLPSSSPVSRFVRDAYKAYAGPEVIRTKTNYQPNSCTI